MQAKLNQANAEKPSFLNKFADLMKLPSFSEHMKQLEESERKPKHNSELQSIYDDTDIATDPDSFYELLNKLQDYNIESSTSTLASGQSSYFSEQIDKSGFEKRLRLREQDVEDARFIASCFNKEINYGTSDLPILYTTLPGTVEFNYATQTFPAGLYEDVFQESADHSLSIEPLVDEPENRYWQRVLSTKLSTQELTAEQLSEALSRGERLINNFCRGKNRIYFLPIDSLKQNHSSFGDVDGLRGGRVEATSIEEILDTLPTLGEEMEQSYIGSVYDAYQNPNFSSEHGVAIYGPIISKDIQYIEVERAYDIMQKRAKTMGLQSGEPISPNNMV